VGENLRIVTDLAYALESFVLCGISVGPAGRGQPLNRRETASPKHGQPGKEVAMITPLRCPGWSPGLELLPIRVDDADFSLTRRW